MTQSKPWNSHLYLLLLVLSIGLFAIPFAYKFTLSEPDLVRMMAAMVYGNALGKNEAAGLHYGLSFSFGYYKFLYAFAPQDWLRSPDLTARLMNGFGIASGIFCAPVCALYLGMVFSRNVSVVAVALFFFSPMMLPFMLSGHPLIAAATFLFFGGWLLSRGDLEQRQWVFLSYCVGAFIVLTFSLTFRAEVVLAFPFLWLASKSRLSGFGASSLWKAYGAKAIVLAGAFFVFLVLQQDYVGSRGSYSNLTSFLESFVSISRMPKGLAVLALSVGWVSLIVAFIHMIRWRFWRKEFFLVLVLALPTLALWLPNPLPARHFFFAGLACAIVIALWIERWEVSVGRKLAIVVCLVLLNQIAAEVVRLPIVSRYDWKYPLVTDRRSTQSLPLGAFPLDQISNQELAKLQRNEALLLAQHSPDRLVILADAAHYIIAHLIAARPELKWTKVQSDGIHANQLKSPTTDIIIISKNKGWPKDMTEEVLKQKKWRDWPVYVQPSTVSKFDLTRVPVTRAFMLPAASIEAAPNLN